MKIYTRSGDQGETSLFGGRRVAKHDQRLAVYGTIDELNSALGVVRALDVPEEIDQAVARIQHELFALGAELATPDASDSREGQLADRHVDRLEADIDRWEADLPPLKQFILPGGSRSGATLHVARCICRRAERDLAALAAAETVRGVVLRYVNRLSDLLFVMARTASQAAGVAETPWDQQI